MKDAKNDEVYKITFDKMNHVKLQRTVTENAVILPPMKIVEELLTE
jgi:hypothetical protein